LDLGSGVALLFELHHRTISPLWAGNIGPFTGGLLESAENLICLVEKVIRRCFSRGIPRPEAIELLL